MMIDDDDDDADIDLLLTLGAQKFLRICCTQLHRPIVYSRF